MREAANILDLMIQAQRRAEVERANQVNLLGDFVEPDDERIVQQMLHIQGEEEMLAGFDEIDEDEAMQQMLDLADDEEVLEYQIGEHMHQGVQVPAPAVEVNYNPRAYQHEEDPSYSTSVARVARQKSSGIPS